MKNKALKIFAILNIYTIATSSSNVWGWFNEICTLNVLKINISFMQIAMMLGTLFLYYLANNKKLI